MYSLLQAEHPSKEPYDMALVKIDVGNHDNSITGDTTCTGVCFNRKDALFEPIPEYLDLIL